MPRHLFIGPGPCNFEIHKYRLFLESVCVGKQEIGLVSDPSPQGHEIPPPSSINTTLKGPDKPFVLLTNEGPSLEKHEHWSKNKHGDDGMRKGTKNGVTSDDFRTLKPA